MVSSALEATNPVAVDRPASGIRVEAASVNSATVLTPAPAGTQLDAPRKFEAYLIQTVFEQLLPREGDAFGSGFAGGVWRSMMAERLANVVAAHGGFGLAAKLSRQQ